MKPVIGIQEDMYGRPVALILECGHWVTTAVRPDRLTVETCHRCGVA